MTNTEQDPLTTLYFALADAAHHEFRLRAADTQPQLNAAYYNEALTSAIEDEARLPLAIPSIPVGCAVELNSVIDARTVAVETERSERLDTYNFVAMRQRGFAGLVDAVKLARRGPHFNSAWRKLCDSIWKSSSREITANIDGRNVHIRTWASTDAEDTIARLRSRIAEAFPIVKKTRSYWAKRVAPSASGDVPKPEGWEQYPEHGLFSPAGIWILGYRPISIGARGLYMLLRAYGIKDGHIQVRREKLAMRMGVTVDRIDEWLKELEKYHLVEKVPTFKANRQLSNVYRTRIPSWVKENRGASIEQKPQASAAGEHKVTPDAPLQRPAAVAPVTSSSAPKASPSQPAPNHATGPTRFQDFGITDEHRRLARELSLDVKAEYTTMKEWAESKGVERVWPVYFKIWMKRRAEDPKNHVAPPPTYAQPDHVGRIERGRFQVVLSALRGDEKRIASANNELEKTLAFASKDGWEFPAWTDEEKTDRIRLLAASWVKEARSELEAAELRTQRGQGGATARIEAQRKREAWVAAKVAASANGVQLDVDGRPINLPEVNKPLQAIKQPASAISAAAANIEPEPMTEENRANAAEAFRLVRAAVDASNQRV